VLKPLRGKDVFDYLRGELVFGTTPKGGKSKLSIGVHRGVFGDAFSWVKELTNEWIVQARLPFLGQSKLKTSIVSTFRVDWDGGPNV